MPIFFRPFLHPGGKVFESFNAVRQERKPFANEAVAQAFLKGARALSREHLTQSANHGDGENTIEQARADARAYNESKRNVR